MKRRQQARRWISALWALCFMFGQSAPLLVLAQPATITEAADVRPTWQSNLEAKAPTTATAGPPTALDIAGPGTMEVGETAVFTATASPTSATVPITFTWELAGRRPYVVSVKGFESTHTVSFGIEGTGYITVTAENVAGSITRVRRVTVVPPPMPDLVARDLTYNGTSITYYVTNVGDATVTLTHTSTLYVDNVQRDSDTISVPIAPGQTLKRLFDRVPVCSGRSDEIRFYVDANGVIPESDEANNRRIETVACDAIPPVITRGPAAFDITQTGAEIRWYTDEASDAVVLYGTRRGAFNFRATSDLVAETFHTVDLPALRPGVTYEYKVQSTDAAGNSVESRPRTFETLPPVLTKPPNPTVSLTRDPDHPGAYQMTATFSDASNVAHVEFFLNGKLIGVDYGNQLAPPSTIAQAAAGAEAAPAPQATQPIPTTAFKTAFVPYKAGFSRETFFSTPDNPVELMVNAIVHTWDRVSYATPVTVQLPSTSEPLRTEAYFEAPEPDHTIYINGDTTPSGTIVPVEVYAAQYDWDCEYAPASSVADCEEVKHAVDYINVYRGSDFITTLEPANDQDFTYATHVDLSGLYPGDHQIRALAVDAEGGDIWIDTFVTVVQRLPSLNVTRDLDRFGSRIRVRLTVENLPEASGLAKLMSVEDVVRGFQVAQDHETYRVRSDYSAWGAETGENAITIDFPDHPGDVYLLDPGESVVLEYWMVPILYDVDMEYDIGQRQVEVRYKELSGDTRLAAFDREELLLQSLVSDATNDANYLIVTAPEVLMWSDSIANVNLLLMTMADLARLKMGVLGYLEEPVFAQEFDDLITQGGAWSARMSDDFETVGEGYVLIVGEQEVIPAWVVHGGDVDISDQPYADTGGAGAPDLVLGRVIGNNASDLRKPIQASIDVYLGNADFDRSKALLTTGGGEGQETMLDHIETIKSKLYNDVGITSHAMAKAPDYHRFGEFSAGHSSSDLFAAGNVLGLPRDQVVFGFAADDFIGFADASDGTQLDWFEQNIASDDTLVIGNVAPGPEDDVLLGDLSSGLIRIFATGGSPTFSPGPWGFGPAARLATGDTDGDGLEEIIFGSAGHLYVYDAVGNEVSGAGFNFDFSTGDRLAAGDVSGGTGGEIIILDADAGFTGAIKVFSPAGSLVASGAPAFAATYSQLAVGNVRWAGSDEIVVKYPGWIYVYSVDANEGALSEVTRMYLSWMDAGDRMALADINGDGVDEILVARPDEDTISQVDLQYCSRLRVDANAWMPESDILVYRGHGNPTSTGCLSSFDGGFGDARPLYFAPTCLSGNYEDDGDDGVAEAFFDADGAVYIGSTEVSYRNYNINAIKGFLGRWGDFDSVGDSFFDLERDVWGSSSDWRRWVREYNLYGDPKFGATPQPGVAIAGPAADAPTGDLSLDLPALVITSTGGIDYVTIPGGDLWLKAGDAQVPIWTATYDYPPGDRVQEIAMSNRTMLDTNTGWVLPLNTLATDNDYAGPVPATAAITETEDSWVPDPVAPFAWQTMDNPDGSTSLLLSVYPFLYHALTTESEYYRHYDFVITTTTTALTITHLSTGQHVYEPGDWVDVELQIQNDDPALDVVVQGDILDDNDDVVSGLLLRSLHELSGPVTFDPTWDSTGTPAGDYRAVVSLIDGNGVVLDVEEVSFRLGTTQGEVTTLTVDPTTFGAGPTFDIALVFSNSGTVPITGTAVIGVYPQATVTPTAVMTRTLANVLPGAAVTFVTEWDATGLPSQDYRITGLVKYDGRATTPLTAELRASFRNYLPLVLRN